MPWTYPKRWTVGEELTSSDLNTYLVNPLRWVGEDAPMCKIRRNSSVQSVGHGSWTSVTFNNEIHDYGNLWSVGLPSRITLPASGVYYFKSTLKFAHGGVGGTGIRAARFRANGSTVFAEVGYSAAGAGTDTTVEISTIGIFSSGYVEVQAFQSSGISLNLTLEGECAPVIEAFWLREFVT